MSAEDLIESLARHQDRLEISARKGGAFEAAVCHQQFAAWYRDYNILPFSIHGVDSKSLFGNFSNGLTQLAGDACRDAEVLRVFSDHALALAEELEAEAAVAHAEMMASMTAAIVSELKLALERLKERW